MVSQCARIHFFTCSKPLSFYFTSKGATGGESNDQIKKVPNDFSDTSASGVGLGATNNQSDPQNFSKLTRTMSQQEEISYNNSRTNVNDTGESRT